MLYSATAKARVAYELAEQHTLEVHEASRLFLDWLSTDAGDKRLDSLTLRRIALLEVSRARRSQGLAGISLLLGAIILFAAHMVSSVRTGIHRLPDAILEDGLELPKQAAKTRSRQRLSMLPGTSRPLAPQVRHGTS